jgi:undecaprenyl pyrophosphate phosphatase UppP
MAASHWVFGIGGPLTWWYLPTIGVGFAALQVWLARRLGVTRDRGRRTSRSTVVSLILAWVCAVGFGLTVPNSVHGELVSILSLASGSSFSAEMSIALCNPLGIVAFALAIVSLAFAYADARDRTPEEDEDFDETPMVPHPLADA